MNLKEILVELGIRLVEEHGFRPSRMRGSGQRDTAPIRAFLLWVNRCPEAQALLAEYGIFWEQPPPPPPLLPLRTDTAEARALIYLNQKQGCQDATLQRRPARLDLPLLHVPYRDGVMEWWTEAGHWKFMLFRLDGSLEAAGTTKVRNDAESFYIADFIWMRKRNLELPRSDDASP